MLVEWIDQKLLPVYPSGRGAARADVPQAELGRLAGAGAPGQEEAAVHLFVQAVILGLLAGGVYALMASGLTLAFGIMRVINVAQGVMIILGAFLSYSLFTRFHIDPFLSILLVVPAVFVLGVVIELVFLRPLRADEREQLSLLVTWAIALGIEGVLGLVYYHDLPLDDPVLRERLVAHRRLPVSCRSRSTRSLMSVVILALLGLMLSRTRFGRAVRGTVQNPMSAALLGVDERRSRRSASASASRPRPPPGPSTASSPRSTRAATTT